MSKTQTQGEIPTEIEEFTARTFSASLPSNQKLYLNAAEFWLESNIDGSQAIYLMLVDMLRHVEREHYTSDCLQDYGMWKEAQEQFMVITGREV